MVVSRLILVRHGQASFLTDDYDRLSPAGEEQSRLLGAWFVRHGLRIDQAYTGPRQRHRDTARLVAEQYAAANLEHPEPQELASLDECHTDLHFDRYLPELGHRFGHLRDLGEAFAAAESHGEQRKSFQHMFDAVMRLYIHGHFHLDGLETWEHFLDRVAESMRTMTDGVPSGSTVVAYTSGGTIAAALHYALFTEPDTTLEFMWQGRNTGLTEFMFSGDRISLSMFNGIPHLDDKALWTHR